MSWVSIIGLEIHAQLLTKTKMFCRCENRFGSEPNTQICPICTGQPGSLPVINDRAIDLGVRAAMALQCEIFEKSIFARKNYFYPDLPKGYQISQYEEPYCKNGKVQFKLKSGEEKNIRIHRIHFEEDAGKSVHTPYGTLVNLNRAGVPLIEIVSEADMRNSEEAGQYLRTIHNILRYAEVCDGNMEQGNFRCDANISVMPEGSKTWGTKVELKNINSFKFVEKAIDYEIKRQISLIESGKTIVQETRGWNSAQGVTESMRAKEQAHDYRYFPEPDLPVLIIDSARKERVRSEMPELPAARQARFQSELGLSEYDSAVLTSTQELAHYFESVKAVCNNPKVAANWVMNELLGRLNAVSKEVTDSPVTAGDLGQLIQKIDSGEISGKIAKTVFEEMFATGKSPSAIIKEKGLVQISDAGQLESVIKQIIANNPAQLADYKAGKVKLLGFFVGQAMKETKGQANPQVLNDLVKKLLDS